MERDNGGISAIVAEHDATLEQSGVVEVGEESSAVRDGRTINKVQETEFVDFDQLFRKDNVRTSQSLNLPKMIRSLKSRGFKPNHPLVVSEKSDGFLVLCGNRRTEGLEVIRNEDPEEFDRIVPGGKVPCIIHRGLTEEQEILIRLDHSDDEDREPLDEWGEFLSVKQLLRAGYSTQKDIAATLGKFNKAGDPNRSYIQQRVNLARLPLFVQEEMKKYCLEGSESTLLRWSHVPGLYSLYNEECDKGHLLEPGPKFKERWAEIMDPEEQDKKPKALTRKSIIDKAKITGSRFARNLLLYVAQEPVIEDDQKVVLEWDTIERELNEAEAALDAMKRLKEYLGPDDFENVMLESKQHHENQEFENSEK